MLRVTRAPTRMPEREKVPVTSPALDEPRAPIGHLPPLRREVLLALKSSPEMTAAGIAELIGCSHHTVRPHLYALESDGYVASRPERGRVGRPLMFYRLTPLGDALFPRGYDEFLRMLFQAMEHSAPGTVQAAIDVLFRSRANDLASEAESVSTRERLDVLKGSLPLFMPVERRIGPGEIELTLVHCPIIELAHEVPAFCHGSYGMVRRLLANATVERTACRTNGDYQCAYRIKDASLG